MAESRSMRPNVQPRVEGLLRIGEVDWCRAGFVTGWSIASSQNPSKVASLLDDPNICAELRSYLRTNKWAMNPQKLAEFTNAKLLPA
jgi:hypothetical protein